MHRKKNSTALIIIMNKRYESMERMPGSDEISGRDFFDSFHLTNRILDSGATCHMTPQITDFIPGSL